uniref:Anaphase-promoting complex subunit 10 n=1 Tax=Globodera rostochiensis TaxID=31243 RepID=A0A914HEU4_GLORO
MSVGLSSIADDPHQRQNHCWAEILPAGIDHVNDISGDAVWTLSSCKEGLGVHQLLNDREDTYCDGLQPHTITIEFQRKTEVNFLLMHLDYKLDESYTPSKIQVQTGASVLELDEPKSVSFSEPSGWQLIDLRNAGKRSSHVFVIVIQIIQNHQNGRDTHIRGLRVLGSSNSHTNMNRRALARNDALAQYLSDPYFFQTTFSHSIR